MDIIEIKDHSWYQDAPDGEICLECGKLAMGIIFPSYGFDPQNDTPSYYLCEEHLLEEYIDW